MATVTSYISLKNYIENFANQHDQIQRFESDFYDQMQNFSTDDNAFPILYMVPNNTTFGGEIDIYNVTFYCFQVIRKDRVDVMNAYSDCQLILNDLKKYIEDGPNTLFGLSPDNTAISEPLREVVMDYVTGAQMTIDIEVDTYTVCDIPLNDE